MKFRDPITDRTIVDITTRTTKGHFNVADWIRIYENTLLTANLISFLKGISIPVTEIAEPTVTTISAVADLNTMLTNIENLRTLSELPEIPGADAIVTDWLDGGSADAPDYEDVNTWERTIEAVRSSIVKSVGYTISCGVATVGQARFYQVRFREFPGYVQDAVSPVRRPRTSITISGVGLTRNNGFRRYS